MKARRGFTLLELLVVMALIAMTTAVVLPAVVRWTAAAAERGWREDLAAALTALPIQAAQEARLLELDAEDVRRLVPEFPSDVEIRLDAPLQYAPNGAAFGGHIEVRRATKVLVSWTIEPISGRLLP